MFMKLSNFQIDTLSNFCNKYRNFLNFDDVSYEIFTKDKKH